MTPLFCTRRLLGLVESGDPSPRAQSRHGDAETMLQTRPASSADESTSADLSDPAIRDGRFGAWWATLVPLRPARLVLAVSEHAQLPVVVAALPARTLLERLPEALYTLLLDIKVPPDLARLERAALRALQPVACSPRDNGALGVLKALAGELEAAWHAGVTRAPSVLSLHLAALPSANLAGATPAQAARRRLHLLPDQTEALGL